MIYVRKRPKSYGRGEQIEGVLKKDAKVILIDDMATNAYSKIKFIEGIKHSEGIVEDVLIVLDRGQGGVEALAEKGIKLHSLITLKELLEYMKSKNMIEDGKYGEVLSYLEQNK